MKKIFLIIFILSFNIIFASEESDIKRPKIGLVLSGGGAKGFAELGVLKVLEENKIPIDYISGTSIGALIGVLYSSGYSTSEIENIVKTMDTSIFFADKIKREDLPMEEKIFSERYALSIPFEDYKLSLPKSLISGQSVYMTLKKHLWDTKDIRNFKDLPIPVHIMTTNINTGEEVVLKKGDLVKALASSMALPAFYNPISWEEEGYVLSDGLNSNNFPVEEVKKMGADIVIGVNVSAPLEDMEDLNFITVLNQIQYYRSYDKTNNQKKMVDVLIEPDTSKYFPLDFTQGKELIRIGEESALEKLPMIKELIPYTDDKVRKKIIREEPMEVYVKEIKIKGLKNIDESFIGTIIKKEAPFYISKDEMEELIKRLYAFTFFERIFYEFVDNTLIFNFVEKSNDKLHLGFNYKNTDGKSNGKLIVGLNLNGLGLKNNKTNIDLNISELPKFTARNYIYYGKGVFGKFGLLTTLNYEKSDVYKYLDEKYPYNTFDKYEADFLLGSITGKRNLIGIGLDFEKIYFEDEEKNSKEENIDYYIKWTYDSYDKTVFPDKGTYLKYMWNIDFKNIFKEDKLYNNFNIYLNNNTPFSKKISLISSLNIANISGNNIPSSKYPLIKGMVEGGQDFSFYGLDSKGIITKNNILAQFGAKYNIEENLFVSAFTNFGVYTDLDDTTKELSGYGISLGRNTDFGPLYLTYSNSEKNRHIYLNFGYEF